MKIHIAILIFLFTLASEMVALGSNVCERSIPSSLRKAITDKYPAYRIATSADQCSKDSKDDEEWNKLYCKKNHCQTVASGDFDGNKQKDFAIYIVKKDSTVTLLIAALRHGAKWELAELQQDNETIMGAYVDTGKPGLYEHTMSYDFQPNDPNEREKIVAKRTCIIAGRVESSGVAYVFDKGKWLYVIFSD